MPLLVLGSRSFEAKAIVFDKDGVLLDFERYWGGIAGARVAGLSEELGLSPADRGELLALFGYPDRVDPAGPLAQATAAEAAAVACGFLYRRGLAWAEARDCVRRAFLAAEERLPPGALAECPGARAVLLTLRERGWRIGVATTDSAAHARHTLAVLEMVDLVDALAGGDEVEHGKPHPQTLERVCARLGVRPAEAIVVGDGVNDLLMARAAGAVAAIGVLGGVSAPEHLAPHADVLLQGVAQLVVY